MAYEMKPNSGSLFINDRREKDTHPNATGTALIDGREYFVDAWTNTSANGVKYQSLKFKLKDKQRAPQAQANNPAPDLDDEIPF